MNTEELKSRAREIAKTLPEENRKEFLSINNEISALMEKLKSPDITPIEIEQCHEKMVNLQDRAGQLSGLPPINTKTKKSPNLKARLVSGLLALTGLGLLLLLVLNGRA
ncbi:hypothetical protein [Zooshikella ganghwensis]|uniref:hypothetical protein n=1 Tax=Zooshikella ganghwensis TaxID=202772 RepID=UPI00040B1695|nr:hypothetical protein [Zooshikella ganghwensis]